MITFKEAKKIVNQQLQINGPSPKGSHQTVPLQEAIGRIVAETIRSPLAVPLFDNSAMDGFALKSGDTKEASEDNPAVLNIVSEARAGDPPVELKQNFSAIRIMTGAPLPRGTDAVIMKEKIIEDKGMIQIKKPVESGTNIRKRGEDISTGDVALTEGKKITPGIAGFLASIGCRNVRVYPLPRVSILATGHELVQSLDDLKPGRIMESNSVLLKAALNQTGIVPHRIKVIEDDPLLLRTASSSALEDSDVVIITGGVSVGEHDHTRQVLEQLGVTQKFWKVAQKPGKPLYFGTRGKHLVFGLPGNPYAVFTSFYLYIRPVLLALMGEKNSELMSEKLPLSADFKKRGERIHFLKGKRIQQDGKTFVEPLKGQGSHLLASLTEADLLIQLPAEIQEFKKGENVQVYYLPY